MPQTKPDDNSEKRFAENAWLNYFNRYLYEHGTISEKEYNRMTDKIAQRQKNSGPAKTIG